MNQTEEKVRKRAPVLLHVAFFFFLVCPAIIAGYVPLRRIFGEPESILFAWPIFLLAWAPVFLWMIFEVRRRDILLAAFFPAVSVFLLWSSGQLAIALFTGIFALLGIDLNE